MIDWFHIPVDKVQVHVQSQNSMITLTVIIYTCISTVHVTASCVCSSTWSLLFPQQIEAYDPRSQTEDIQGLNSEGIGGCFSSANSRSA